MNEKFCFQHGKHNGICKKCQKSNFHALQLKINKEYQEKFSEEERNKFSILWSFRQ